VVVTWSGRRLRWRQCMKSALFDRAMAWLITREILLPGMTALERHIVQIRDLVGVLEGQLVDNHLVQAQAPARFSIPGCPG
jgi:hypothetical protein